MYIFISCLILFLNLFLELLLFGSLMSCWPFILAVYVFKNLHICSFIVVFINAEFSSSMFRYCWCFNVTMQKKILLISNFYTSDMFNQLLIYRFFLLCLIFKFCYTVLVLYNEYSINFLFCWSVYVHVETG